MLFWPYGARINEMTFWATIKASIFLCVLRGGALTTHDQSGSAEPCCLLFHSLCGTHPETKLEALVHLRTPNRELGPHPAYCISWCSAKLPPHMEKKQ